MLLHELRDDAVESFLRVDDVAGARVGGVQHALDEGEWRHVGGRVAFGVGFHGAVQALQELGKDPVQVVEGQLWRLCVVGVSGKDARCRGVGAYEAPPVRTFL